MNKTIQTEWELWSYDMWGNDEDGYTVNDRYCFNRRYPLRLRVEVNNPGTPMEFKSASPSDSQIGRAFGFGGLILTEGDDMTIYVARARDEYPIGKMNCISHTSLSPIGEEVQE